MAWRDARNAHHGLVYVARRDTEGKEKMEITNRVNHAYKKNSYLEVRGDKEKENIVWRENI